MDRRSFVKGAALSYATISSWLAAGASQIMQIKMPVPNTQAPKPRKVAYKRIATEEAWGPAEMFQMYTTLININPFAHPGLASMWGPVGNRAGEGGGTAANPIVTRLADIGEGRISDMDASGIDLALIFLTAPACRCLMPRRQIRSLHRPTINSPRQFANIQLALPASPRLLLKIRKPPPRNSSARRKPSASRAPLSTRIPKANTSTIRSSGKSFRPPKR